MNNLKEILGFPNGTPIEAVQAKLDRVYDYKSMTTKFGPTTVQAIMLADGAGNKIRASVWGHPDMKEQEGGEFIFSGGKGGKGLIVKIGTYEDKPTIELSMSKAGTMQFIQTYHAQNGTKPAEALPEPAKAPIPAGQGPDTHLNPIVRPTPINGAKVGGVLHDAVALLVASEDITAASREDIVEGVKGLAVLLLRLSNDLESGAIAI